MTKQNNQDQTATQQTPANQKSPSTSGTKDCQWLIDQYLAVFRHMKYGVLETDTMADGRNKLIVIEAPRFTGDFQPVCEPAYFESTEESLSAMLDYYFKCEALFRQRFEEIRVMDILRALAFLVAKMEFNHNFAKAYIVFDNSSKPPYNPAEYDLNVMGLSCFIRDLLDYGELLEDCLDDPDEGIHLREIARKIFDKFNFTAIGWQVINARSWLKNSESDILKISIPFGRSGHTKTIGYTNDADGALAFIMQLFRALSQQQLRDFLADPNGEESEANE